MYEVSNTQTHACVPRATSKGPVREDNSQPSEEENQLSRLENEEKKAKLRASKAHLSAIHTVMKARAGAQVKLDEQTEGMQNSMDAIKNETL